MRKLIKSKISKYIKDKENHAKLVEKYGYEDRSGMFNEIIKDLKEILSYAPKESTDKFSDYGLEKSFIEEYRGYKIYLAHVDGYDYIESEGGENAAQGWAFTIKECKDQIDEIYEN